MKKYLIVLLLTSLFTVSCTMNWKTEVDFYGFALGEQHFETMNRLQDMLKLGKISNTLDTGLTFVDKRIVFYPLPSNTDFAGIQAVGIEFVGSVKNLRSYLVEIDFLMDKTPVSDGKIAAFLDGFSLLSNSVTLNQFQTESNSYYVFTNKALDIEAKHSKLSNTQRLVVVYWGCVLYIQEHEQ